MEIERKYLIPVLPEDLKQYPYQRIEQGYLCTDPVIRVRRQDDAYILTYKSCGLLEREEYNLLLHAEAYAHLKEKADGIYIEKVRYRIPYGNYTIELDVFRGQIAPLKMAEVEFSSAEEANAFVPPDWFGEDVTFDARYQNSWMSVHGYPKQE